MSSSEPEYSRFGLRLNNDLERGQLRVMQFYDLKTRAHIDVPESNVKKTKMKRKTKNGEQIRYALKGSHDGRTLYKFVNEATFNATNVPEEN